jgi:hypothetical protein
MSQVFIAYAGVSPQFECEFWTDADENDAADPGARADAEALIGYRDANAPDVRVLLSIGGPLLSYRLSAAARAENRSAFVTSCIQLMTELGADGIDVDWRFPTAFAGPASGPGSCPDATGCDHPDDAENFTRLLQEFRDQLSESARGKLLTSVLRANTTSGGGSNVPYEYEALSAPSPRVLDWATVAAFDMHGSAATVDFGAPFDETVNALNFAQDRMDTNLGRDLFLGVSFNGPYWSGVAEPGPSGVGGAGTPVGVESYRTVKNYLGNFADRCEVRRPETGDVRNRYVYCSGMVGQLQDLWFSYDDTTVLLNKAKYTTLQPFAGVSWWYQGQDSSDDELVKAIVSGMDEQHPYGDEPQSLPALVQAENYDSGGQGLAFESAGGATSELYRLDDASIEVCTDRGGGLDVPMLGTEWFEYTVTPEFVGAYNVEFRVAGTGGSLHLEEHTDEGNAVLTEQVQLPGTGGMQTWTTVEATSPSVRAVEQALRIVVDTGDFSLNWFRFTRGQSPYLGLPVSIPGTVQTESFDIGGRGVAWYDLSGTEYVVERVGPVEIQPNFDLPAGLHVTGWQTSEWLEYTVDVEQAGLHNLELRAAAGAAHTVHLQDAGGTNVSGALTIPFIGEADEFLTVEARTQMTLASGVQVLRFVNDNAGAGRLNLNWMRITRGQVASGGAQPTPLPGTLEAEAFDLGGAEVAYHDSTVGNGFREYRYTDVDIEVTQDENDGFNLAQVVADEWIEFTVSVEQAGSYDVEVRAASNAGSASMRLENAAGTTLGTVAITETGGNQVWESFMMADVPLAEGPQVLRVYFETPRASYNWFKFTGPN